MSPDPQPSDPQPFDHLLAHAEATPSAAFFHDRHTSMTYSEALAAASRVAGLMRSLGVRPGDSVALDLPASLHLVFFAAVFHEAAISSMLTPAVGSPQPFVADWLFTQHPGESPFARRTVHVDRALLRDLEDRSAGLEPIRYRSPQEICRIVFSSGTTGYPKPVAFTVEMIEHRARAASGFWMRTPPFMSFLDVGTVSGFQTFYASLSTGVSYLVPGDGEHNVEMLRRHCVASIKASPAQIAALVEALRTTGETLPDLRIIQFAGTVLPPAVARAARAATGAEIHNLYGSTETGTVSTRYYDSDDPYDAGFVTEGSAVEIVDDDDDRVVPAGEVGRIRYRRHLQAEGYHLDPVATASAFRDGWFYPGDLGRLEPDGHLWLAGRASEIVNAGGVKIDPARVDAVACEHPGVREAAGFAHVDPLGMTQFVLAVVAGEGFDGRGLVQLLTHSFGSARPSTVVLVDAIPRNGMGKPLRLELARWFAEQRPATGS